MSMRLDQISIVLFGIGILVLVHALLSGLAGALSGLTFRRRGRLANMLGNARKGTTAVKATPDDLLGLGKIPWVQLYLLALAAGAGLYLFTQQILMIFVVVIPFAVRIWLTNKRKSELNNEVLAFLTDLRLSLPLQGSLMRAMQEVAVQGGTRLAGITARYLKGGFSGSGLDLLEMLARDTQVTYLSDLVAWTKAAEAGTMAVDAPFEHALARLQAETYTSAMENLQSIPNRLTLFVLPALLGPSIVVLLYPVAARLLAGMGGNGWGAGF